THVVQQRNGRLASAAFAGGSAGPYNRLEEEAEAAERDFERPLAPLSARQAASGNAIHRSPSDTLDAIRAAASGGINKVADFVAGVAIPVAVLILFVAFLIVVMWLLLRANPDIRRRQDKAVEDLIDKIREAGRPRPAPPEPEPDPKQKPPQTGPTIGPNIDTT